MGRRTLVRRMLLFSAKRLAQIDDVIQAKWDSIVSEVEEIASNPKKRFKTRVPVY